MNKTLSLLERVKQMACNDYLLLCKPKLLLFILFTSLVGLLLALDDPIVFYDLALEAESKAGSELSPELSPELAPELSPELAPEVPPESASNLWSKIIPGILGITFAAAGGIVYHQLMVLRNYSAKRGFNPTQCCFNNKISWQNACCFSLFLCLAAVILLAWVNYLILILVWFAFFSHAVFYSSLLKQHNSSKILSTAIILALAPILGWGVVSQDFNPQVFSLALVIFFWIQVYFWVGKLLEKYQCSAEKRKKFQASYYLLLIKKKIFLCTTLIYIFAMTPFLFNLSGEVYIIGAFVLGVSFLQKAFALLIARAERDTIHLSEILKIYSAYYLPALFTLMLVDHYLFFGADVMLDLSQKLL